MVSHQNYDEKTKAVQSVLMELMDTLSPYWKHLVVVGGSVPNLLFPNSGEPHLGTLDVDLAIDREIAGTPVMATLETRLTQKGYRQSESKPCLFTRTINHMGKEYRVEVDLLTGENGAQPGASVQPLHGCDLAFEEPMDMDLPGSFPGGRHGTVKLKVASIVSFICMKAIAYENRMKNKDAYDIYYCLKNQPESLEDLAKKFKIRMDNPLVKEAVKNLSKLFDSP
jgi:hypothetical protein